MSLLFGKIRCSGFGEQAARACRQEPYDLSSRESFARSVNQDPGFRLLGQRVELVGSDCADYYVGRLTDPMITVGDVSTSVRQFVELGIAAAFRQYGLETTWLPDEAK